MTQLFDTGVQCIISLVWLAQCELQCLGIHCIVAWFVHVVVSSCAQCSAVCFRVSGESSSSRQPSRVRSCHRATGAEAQRSQLVHNHSHFICNIVNSYVITAYLYTGYMYIKKKQSMTIGYGSPNDGVLIGLVEEERVKTILEQHQVRWWLVSRISKRPPYRVNV